MLDEIIKSPWWVILTSLILPILLMLIPYCISLIRGIFRSKNIVDENGELWRQCSERLREYVVNRPRLSPLERDLWARSLSFIGLETKVTDFLIISTHSFKNIEKIKRFLKLGIITFDNAFVIPTNFDCVKKWPLSRQIKYKIVLHVAIFILYCIGIILFLALCSIELPRFGFGEGGFYLAELSLHKFVNFLILLLFVALAEIICIIRIETLIELLGFIKKNESLFLKKSNLVVDTLMLEKAVQILEQEFD